MLPPFTYVRAADVGEALDALDDREDRIHAGGTDLLGCLHDGVFDVRRVVSISGIESLRGLAETPGGGLRIGALVTLAEIASDPTIAERFPGLSQAAHSAASPQLRNQGTIGGNLCQRPRCWYYRGEFDCLKKGGDLCFAEDGENRYHAILGGGPCHIVHPSDTAPMLLALGASVRLRSPRGERRLPLEDFFHLPVEDVETETILEPGEILTEVEIPAPASGLATSYRKVRERSAWDFALSSVALALVLDGRRVTGGRIVLGGVAPVPWRAEAAEAELIGREPTPEVIEATARAAVADAEPLEQNGFKVPLTRGAVRASLDDLLT